MTIKNRLSYGNACHDSPDNYFTVAMGGGWWAMNLGGGARKSGLKFRHQF
jgi:hypothetical protein